MNQENSTNTAENQHLVVLWTSPDREVALKMAFMYTFNSKARGWWEDVTLLVWGPSAQLLSEDKELQEYIAKMKEAGVNLMACRACADSYGVTQTLENLGITVEYAGQPLTEFLKKGYHVLTV